MSGRPSAQGPPASSADDGKAVNQRNQANQPNPQRDVPPMLPPSAAASPSTAQRYSSVPGRGLELPPLAQASGANVGGFQHLSSRSSMMPSILNPSQPEESQQGRRRKVSELESPSLPPLMSSSQPAPHVPSLTSTSPITRFSGPAERPVRRILTPRSPTAHRAANFGQLNPPAATIDAQQSPFPVSPRSRNYTTETGSGAPPQPTPPTGFRSSYGFPSAAPTPPSQARRSSAGASIAPRAPSSSASPSASYSDYSQPGAASPAAQYAPMSMSTLSAPYNASGDAASSGPGTSSAPPGMTGQDRQRPYGIPISSSGSQNVYQMMTLETTSGTVQLPVDVQAASRVADEKRRRNAGASARFRQRRKEKEREASTTISKLDQQIKEAVEDAEFYKRERDYLAGVVLQVPGGERHFPRPPSPRHRRPSAALSGPSGSGSGYISAQEQGGRSPEQGRNVRRRTSTFSLPPPPPQMAAPGPPLQPGYGPPGYAPPMQQQPPPGQPVQSPIGRVALPGSSAYSHAHTVQQQQPPQLMQASPQIAPYNPYAPDRYDRGRPPGGPGASRDGR